ncbi:type IX secretion system periplasmic lipoprotein PorW/SprE [Wenyingzhuangia sp. IMCC45574]
MKHYLFYISVFLLAACSTRKDKFVNRKYHALITKFNVFYNGKVAYDKGLEKVEKTYSDDFTEILPVEPFSFYANQDEADDVKPIGQADFDRAEEKATKAIQRHSMLIDGEERNSQTDEAYLLLGKSRYYTKRFGPALESFEYIIKNYPEASLIYETVVWRAKSNIHINNVGFAKKALQRLLSVPQLPEEVRQQAEIGMVMAYEKSKDSLDMKVKHLEKSLKAIDQGSVASRVGFILGQCYREQGKIAKSDKAFQQVIDMKGGLYKFKIQARMELMNNHRDELHREPFLEELDHLLFITKNRAYRGKLFYQKGIIYQDADSINLAKQFYTESVLKSTKDIDQKILSYEKLGDLFFDEKLYRTSKSYYDSLVSVATNKKSKRVLRIKRVSKSLERVVNLEEQSIANDSLLKIASLNEQDLQLFFKNYIERLKEQEKQARVKELKALAEQNTVSYDDGKSDWYFFNTKERVQGKIDFVKEWKITQKNKNWYASYLSKGNTTNKQVKDSLATGVTKEINKEAANKYKVAYYTSKINRDPKFLDSIFRIRNLNYYELGNIYYTQLKEKELAVDKLETLIAYKPSKDLKVGAYYRLYKIHKETEDFANSNLYKQKLNVEFPKSSFTKLVNHTKKTGENKEEAEEYIRCYETIYSLYELKSYKAAAEEIDGAIENFGDSPLAAKYQLLHAFILAKTKGKEEYLKKLKEIKLKYPNSIESKKAMEILKNK